MGAWGAGYFDNDDAGDFISEVADGGGWSFVRVTLETAAMSAPDQYLELSQGRAAIAAAALFAQKIGKLVATDFPDDLEVIATLPPPPDLNALALAALARVRGENSEIVDLWEGDEGWRSTLDVLEAALQ